MDRWDPCRVSHGKKIICFDIYFFHVFILKNTGKCPRLKGEFDSFGFMSSNISSFKFNAKAELFLCVGIGTLMSWGLCPRPWTWLRVRMERWWLISDILYVQNDWSGWQRLPAVMFIFSFFCFAEIVCRLWRSRNAEEERAAVMWVGPAFELPSSGDL